MTEMWETIQKYLEFNAVHFLDPPPDFLEALARSKRRSRVFPLHTITGQSKLMLTAQCLILDVTIL